MAIYYHRTDKAEAIFRDGFRDGDGIVGAYHAGIEGVFLSNYPLDRNEGAKGDQLLEITWADTLMRQIERRIYPLKKEFRRRFPLPVPGISRPAKAQRRQGQASSPSQS